MSPRIVCIGPQILDMLVRPVTAIPEGQGGVLLEEARITAAGTAAGTAVDMAKLGATVTSIGAVGDDAAGKFLRTLLQEHGVDASHLVTKVGEQTSMTVLPIRPNGERPSLHLAGATKHLTGADIDGSVLREADFIHLGGPDVLGAFGSDDAPALLREAKARGTVTTVDLLRSNVDPHLLTTLERLWPHVDYFLPNDDQLRALTGIQDLERAAARVQEFGVGTVAVTIGAEGSLIVAPDSIERVPAFTCSLVDSTGCGDAYAAGFIVGLGRNWDLGASARLGTAAAALVAQGLGSDAGIIDLESTLSFWRSKSEEVGYAPPNRLTNMS
jgi:sugar/nucleoside kinase (ribokinase family)